MKPADAANPRQLVYALLITVAAAAVAGRLVSAERVYEPSLFKPEEGPDARRRGPWPRTRPDPTPMFSSNDRSRWATIRALVDQGTYAIGRRDVTSSPVGLLAAADPLQAVVLWQVGKNANFRYDSGIIFEDAYQSVDKVLDPHTLKFYSSKPPLLPTLLAGEYWVLKQLGWSIEEDRWLVVMVILFTVLWLPLIIYLFLMARLLEWYGRTDWGRYYVLAAACFGTIVTLFAISLNNHVVSTCTAVFALYPALRVWQAPGKLGEWWGGRLARRLGAAEGGPAAGPPARHLFVVAGFFAGFTACDELPALALTAALFVLLLLRAPGRTLLYFLPAAVVPIVAFFATNYLAVGQLLPVQSQFGSPWYNYPGSHWARAPGEEPHGIDWARLYETRGQYAFHVFLGHHGLFSLSPIYLLAAVGMVAGTISLFRRKRAPDEPVEEAGAPRPPGLPRVLFPLALSLSVVVVAFYLVKTDNYGGWTNGLRWLMWLIPFWLLALLPVADRLAGRRWGRALGYLLLAASVFSVHYRSWNPWRLPWIFTLMEYLGWPGY